MKTPNFAGIAQVARGNPRPFILAGVVIALLAYLLWSWYGGPAPVSTRDYKTAQAPRELAGEQKKTVAAKAQVYSDKKQVMRKLGMSDDDAGDDEEVENAAEIPATPAGGKAVVFLNTTTGKSRVAFKANPLPFWSLEKGTEIGARYGVTTRGGQSVAVFLRRDLARIGRAYVSGYAEANAGINGARIERPEAKGMIEVSGRFHNVPGLE